MAEDRESSTGGRVKPVEVSIDFSVDPNKLDFKTQLLQTAALGGVIGKSLEQSGLQNVNVTNLTMRWGSLSGCVVPVNFVEQVDIPQVLQRCEDLQKAMVSSGKVVAGSSQDRALEDLSKLLVDTKKLIETKPTERSSLSGMSRRAFLKAFGVGTAAIVAPGVVWRWVDTQRMGGVAVPENRKLTELEENVKFLRDIYGFNIYTGVSLIDAMFGGIEGDRPSEELLNIYVATVRKAIVLYPPDYFRRNGFTGLSIVSNYRSSKSSEPLAGAAWQLPEGWFYINAYDHPDPSQLDWTNLTIHHEAFHRLDYGTLESLWLDKAEWRKLGQATIDNVAREYGMRNIFEDRATYAESLFYSERFRGLQEKINKVSAKDGGIIKRKIEIIEEAYEKLSGGKMNKQYWEDVRAGKVGYGYFK